MNTSAHEDKFSNTDTTPSVDDRRQVVLAGNRLDSRDLFAGIREITIAHGDEVYRLRLTAQNKLILTK
jgi:hemin uptake protein HemP